MHKNLQSEIKAYIKCAPFTKFGVRNKGTNRST